MTLPLPQDVLGPNFTNFLLPWLFTFAVVFGLLSKVDIFGAKKQINVALAFVIAFFVTATGGPQLAAFFINLFGGAATFIAGILVIILFVAMVGKKPEEELGKHKIILVVLVIIGAALFLVSQAPVTGFRLDQQTSSLIFWAVVILAVIYYMTHGGTTSDGGAGTKPKTPSE